MEIIYTDTGNIDLIQCIDNYLNSKKREGKSRDYFYITETTKMKTEIFKSMKGQNKDFDAQTKRIFETGDDMHKRYYKYFAEMGILVASEIDVGDLLIHGRCDAIITDKKKNYILDLKTINFFSFSKMDAPLHDHEVQLQFYMYYTNIPNGMLLYEDKNTSRIKVYHLTLDKQRVERYIQKLKEFKEQIDAGITHFDENINVEDLVNN